MATSKNSNSKKVTKAKTASRPLAWAPTAEDVKTIEKNAGLLTRPQLADLFGVSEVTFRARMMDTPGLADAYKKGRAYTLRRVAGRLVGKALSGDTIAMLFYLKTQGGWNERGPELEWGAGGPTEVVEWDLSKLTVKELKELKALASKAQPDPPEDEVQDAVVLGTNGKPGVP